MFNNFTLGIKNFDTNSNVANSDGWVSNLLSKNNIKVSDEVNPEVEDTTDLQESINRIKTLMFG